MRRLPAAWPTRSASSRGSGRRSRSGGRPRPALPTRTDSDFTSVSGRSVEPVYTPLDLHPGLHEAAGLPGEYPVHPRHPPDDVSRQALDDAPVRRLRQRRRHQRAVQVPARARADRALGRVRLSDPDGLRLRPSAVGGRGGQVRRRHLEPGRHGDAVRRDPARPGLDLDDDQRPGRDAVLLLRRRRREARACRSSSSGARSRTTS